MSEPWERKPDESPQAYAAALIYFELGPDRSLKAVAQSLAKGSARDRKGIRIPQHVRSWCAKYGWVERARAYDARDARIRHDATAEVVAIEAKSDAQVAIERRRAQQERCWKMAELVQDRIVRTLESDPLKLDGLESLLAAFVRSIPVADKAIATALPNGVPSDAPRPDQPQQQSNAAVRRGLIAAVSFDIAKEQG